ncbi:hypothetical protein SAMN06265339_1241 [Desulfurobacterium pacificum]|uniref:Type II secretion system protein GspN n=1 Tax=Desulfurobacterium pacificum TaxID=240166 RepID=A0ABY1NN70_9BACT|nr:hypothetical protein [Desulfurobacterium pacificum]SMP14014.1 hypothetical protein SAMN06265339_1241 [Desulfurobacterium pacificum]
MKKVLYALVFLIALAVSLYLTFPFERFIGNYLCEKGVEYEKVEFHRFPPAVVIEKFKHPSFPLIVDKLELQPVLSTLPKSQKEFHVVARLCNGKVVSDLTYPLKELTFKVDGINLRCLLKTEFKNVAGKLYGKGNLSFGDNGSSLIGGRGSFYTNDLKISGLKFGIFTLPDVKVGKAKLDYVVKSKNYVELKGTAVGKVDVKANGFMRVNLKDFGRTYLSLNARVVLKEGPFKNKPFKFRIAGYLSNLSVR